MLCSPLWQRSYFCIYMVRATKVLGRRSIWRDVVDRVVRIGALGLSTRRAWLTPARPSKTQGVPPENRPFSRRRPSRATAHGCVTDSRHANCPVTQATSAEIADSQPATEKDEENT